jgi:pyruvate kinase
MIRELILAGIDVVRLNFSYGTHEQHKNWIITVRKLSSDLGKPVAILQDLAGPKFRVGNIEKGSISLEPGSIFVLTNRKITGNEHEVSVSYPDLTNALNVGDTILLADGSIGLLVKDKTATDLICEVTTGGILSSHKGINLPTSTLTLPSLTSKDEIDLEFGISQQVDFVALSFVRKAADIIRVKEIISAKKGNIPVIAKIEKPEALNNLEEILAVADGIMIARGDLGVEIPLEKVPFIQKMLITKANEMAKPVITATQMLKSMVENPRPTRAEVSDIANAILDGADALMLSEETASGNYPLEAVKVMDKIAQETEKTLPYNEILRQKEYYKGETIPEAISHAACYLARDLGVKAIITLTRSGNTAKLIARFRPEQPIIALSPRIDTVRRLVLSWGVYPFLIKEFINIEEIIKKAGEIGIASQIVGSGERVVITGSLPLGVSGITNLIKAHVIDCD